jgi:phage terminase large subunit GpA-like protein
LSPESSAEPGRWNTSRAEYLRGIMDAMTDPRIERVVLMTCARVGKTQTLNNLIGFHIHLDPAPILVVWPTVERAEEWADDEFDPMIRDTPVLRAIMGDRKSRSAKHRRLHRQFPGGRLHAVGANAPSGLAQKTIRVVVMDEVDRYPASAGEEGDPVALAEKRTATVWNRKIVLSSTPTFAGSSRIEAAYLASDRRRYWVPCPHCGHEQLLRWPQVKWDEGRPETARYHCESCDAGWTDAERYAAVSRGKWKAEGELGRAAGFHLNEIYSPFRRLEETVRDFLEAKRHPERLKVWVMTALGETWQDRGEAPDWERLVERREDFQIGVVPDGALCLTAGVDVQDDRLECDVWGWADGYTSWLVDHVVIRGSPRERETWDELAAVLDKDWPREDGGAMRIAKACVDTGGRDTTAVYGQLRRLHDPRIAATKGVEGWNRAQPVQGPTPVDALVDGRKMRRGLKLWTVAVSTWKADLYRRLWIGRGDAAEYPPGWVHLPRGIEVEWVKQLVAEQLHSVRDRRGFVRQEWQKLRERNEALDCAVLARAALWLLGADRYGERFWQQMREQLDVLPPKRSETLTVSNADALPVPPPATLRPSTWLKPRGGWLR